MGDDVLLMYLSNVIVLANHQRRSPLTSLSSQQTGARSEFLDN